MNGGGGQNNNNNNDDESEPDWVETTIRRLQDVIDRNESEDNQILPSETVAKLTYNRTRLNSGIGNYLPSPAEKREWENLLTTCETILSAHEYATTILLLMNELNKLNIKVDDVIPPQLWKRLKAKLEALLKDPNFQPKPSKVRDVVGKVKNLLVSTPKEREKLKRQLSIANDLFRQFPAKQLDEIIRNLQEAQIGRKSGPTRLQRAANFLMGGSKPNRVSNDNYNDYSAEVDNTPLLTTTPATNRRPQGKARRQIPAPQATTTRPIRTRVTNAVKQIGTLPLRKADKIFSESSAPKLTFCLAFTSAIMFFVVLTFIIITFSIKDAYPVISPDVFMFSSISATLVFLRTVRTQYWFSLTVLSLSASVLNLVANIVAFRAVQNYTFDDASAGVIRLGSGINRTVVNAPVAHFDTAVWDGTKTMYVLIMIFEAWTVMWLVSLGCYQGCFAIKARDRQTLGLGGDDDDDYDDDVAEFDDDDSDGGETINSRLTKTGQRGTRVLTGTVHNLLTCRWFDFSSCCPARATSFGWYGAMLLYPLYMVAVISGIIIMAYLGFLLVAIVEHYPMWTTMYSPHYLLIGGIVLFIVPPVGETFYIPTPKKGDAAGGNYHDAAWSPVYAASWLLLFGGAVMSGFALEFQRERVEYTAGAQWLQVGTYETALNCTSTTTVELYGGYALTCNPTALTTRSKLVMFSYGQHIFELILVILGCIILALTMMIFCFDFSSVYSYSVKIKRGPTQSHPLPDGMSATMLMERAATGDRVLTRYVNNLGKLLNEDPTVLDRVGPRDREELAEAFNLSVPSNDMDGNWTPETWGQQQQQQQQQSTIGGQQEPEGAYRDDQSVDSRGKRERTRGSGRSKLNKNHTDSDDSSSDSGTTASSSDEDEEKQRHHHQRHHRHRHHHHHHASRSKPDIIVKVGANAGTYPPYAPHALPRDESE